MARDRDQLDPGTDPTRITNQPALTSSSGRIWYILGGLFAAISIGVLALLIGIGAPGVAWFGIIAVAALYLVMLLVGLTTAPGRRRLGLLATAMLAMAAVALGCVIVIMLTVSVGGQ